MPQSENRHFALCLQWCARFHARKNGEPPYSRTKPFVLSSQTPCTLRPKRSVPLFKRGLYLCDQRGLYLCAKEVCTFRQKRSVPLSERGLYLLTKEVCTFERKVQTSLTTKYRGFEREVRGFGREVQRVCEQSTGGQENAGPGSGPRILFAGELPTAAVTFSFPHVARGYPLNGSTRYFVTLIV